MNAWVAIDVNLPDHPKFLAAGVRASWVWLRALCYAKRVGTDGKVPAGILKSIGCSPSDAKVLVDVGLWETSDDGFRIHDFHDYQQSREEVEERKKQQRERWHKWKSKRVANALANDGANALPTDPQNKTRQDKQIREEEDPPAAAPTGGKSRPKSDPHPDHKRVVDAYSAAFERAKGAKPLIGAKGGAAVRRMLGEMSGDQAVAVIEAAFRDSWFVQTQASLTFIAANPNRFLGSTPQSGTRIVAATQVQPVPAQGSIWKVGGGS